MVVRSGVLSVLLIMVSVPVIMILTWSAGTAWPCERSMQFSVSQRYLVSSVACSRSLRGQSTPEGHGIAISVQPRWATRPT
jgi:hypothetical protein